MPWMEEISSEMKEMMGWLGCSRDEQRGFNDVVDCEMGVEDRRDVEDGEGVSDGLD